MTVRCNNKECELYHVEIEENLDEDGNYRIGYNTICKCGLERERLNRVRQCNWNIDELALGTKRMYETKVKQYN